MHEVLRSAHVRDQFYEALPYQQEHWIRLIRRVGSETGDNLAHELHESVFEPNLCLNEQAFYMP